MSDALWTIYPPNSLLKLDTGSIKECWICRDVVEVQGEGLEWVIRGLRIGYNGTTPGMAKQEFVITLPSTGPRPLTISDLPLTPIRHRRKRELWEELFHKRYDTAQHTFGPDPSSLIFNFYTGPAWKDRQLHFMLDKVQTRKLVISMKGSLWVVGSLSKKIALSPPNSLKISHVRARSSLKGAWSHWKRFASASDQSPRNIRCQVDRASRRQGQKPRISNKDMDDVNHQHPIFRNH